LLPLSAFTEDQLTRLQDSVQQVRRGEVISEEQVDKFFEEWFQELEAR
jgi:hypothetical protein